MDDLDFVHDNTSDLSHATLKAVLPTGQVCHISDSINPYRLIDHCPLLFHAFEVGHRGQLQASIDAPSASAVIALFRYCYTGNHLNARVENQDMVLLFHLHLYKMAADFDLPELQLLANGSFLCHLEAAACLQDRPADLLEAIRFIYQYFASHKSRYQHGLVATLCNYCISTYVRHNLGHSQGFLTIISEIPAFGQDLCRTNIERDFEDDCAGAIICLPPDHTGGPSNNAAVSTLASEDLSNEILYGASFEPSGWSLIDEINETFDRRGRDRNDSSVMVTSTTTLVHRPLIPRPMMKSPPDDGLSSDEDGFTVVFQPNQLHTGAKDELLSSPELLPSVSFNILTATGSEHPSDDEWSML